MRWAADYGIPIVNTAVGGHQSADENESAFLANIGAMADAAEQAGRRRRASRSTATSWPRATSRSRCSRRSAATRVKVNYDTANVEFYSGDKAVDDLPKIVDAPRARPPEGHDGRQGRLGLRRDRHRRRRLRARARDPRATPGYDGPYSVEIEFQGEPWPPLAEVNAAMRGSREHLNGLGLS